MLLESRGPRGISSEVEGSRTVRLSARRCRSMWTRAVKVALARGAAIAQIECAAAEEATVSALCCRCVLTGCAASGWVVMSVRVDSKIAMEAETEAGAGAGAGGDRGVWQRRSSSDALHGSASIAGMEVGVNAAYLGSASRTVGVSSVGSPSSG